MNLCRLRSLLDAVERDHRETLARVLLDLDLAAGLLELLLRSSSASRLGDAFLDVLRGAVDEILGLPSGRDR